VADLVREDLLVEETNATGDGGLVGEQRDAPVAQHAEDDTARHLGGTGERLAPALGDTDEYPDHATSQHGRRMHPEGQAEDADDIGEEARVVVLLQPDAQLERVVRIRQAVQLAEPDAEALGLVRPGGREQPEHALVQAALGPPA